MGKLTSLGLIDFGYRQDNLNSMDRVSDLFRSVVLAERLGYHRYWITEHHTNDIRNSWSNPQAILPMLVSYTDRIRIGVAGVLLDLYSPYHIATYFKLLNNVSGNRIDLGLANGRPSKQIRKYSLGSEAIDNRFYEKLRELVWLLRSDDALGTEDIVIPPFGGAIPELWALSTSAYQRYDEILKLKINFARSICHYKSNQEPQKDIFEGKNREYLLTNSRLPSTVLVIGFVCQKTMKQALRAAEQYKSAGPYLNIVGCPFYVKDRLFEISEQYGMSDIVLYDYSDVVRERNTAMKLISKVMNLI